MIIYFAIVIAFVVAIFAFSLVLNISLDYTALITLVSVSGGVFGTSAGFYYNKAKAENLYKIKSSYLKIISHQRESDAITVKMEFL